MRNAIRFAALWLALTMSVACGAGNQQQAAPESQGGAAAPSAAPTGSAVPGPPAAPPMMPMDVASGTELHLILETPVSSETAKPEQAVRARVAKPVVVAGMTVIPEGASVTGTVVSVERAGRVKGRASVALGFDRVIVADAPYEISTSQVIFEAGATLSTTIQKTVRINAPM